MPAYCLLGLGTQFSERLATAVGQVRIVGLQAAVDSSTAWDHEMAQPFCVRFTLLPQFGLKLIRDMGVVRIAARRFRNLRRRS